jgi:D-lactate dehydrogenase (cytochrome)
MEVFARARAATGDQLTAFELIPRFGLDIVVKHAGAVDPIAERFPWYALIEISSSQAGANLREALEEFLAGQMEEGLVTDATIAASAGQAGDLWRIREALAEVQKFEGGSIKHDVSIPVSRVPEFLARATAAVAAACPGIRPCAFGHVGDGNIHFNLTQPEGADRAEYLARWEEMNRIVHDIVTGLGGSISAEHGIGRLKVEELTHYKAPLELELMRKVKRALDPENLMNPGKVVSV